MCIQATFVLFVKAHDVPNYVETHICEFISCAKEMKSGVLAKTPISVSVFLLCLYTYK